MIRVRPHKTSARVLARTHCAQGHEWIPDNLRTDKGNGSLYCRICRAQQTKAAQKRYQAEHAALYL